MYRHKVVHTWNRNTRPWTPVTYVALREGPRMPTIRLHIRVRVHLASSTKVSLKAFVERLATALLYVGIVLAGVEGIYHVGHCLLGVPVPNH